MLCPACSGRRAPHGDFYDPDGTIMRPDGLHVLSCRETGNGGALGLTSGRHTHVKFTVIGVIKKFGSKDSITTDCNGNDKEPVCEDLFPPKGRLGVKLPSRGDILLDLGGVIGYFPFVSKNKDFRISRIFFVTRIFSKIAKTRKDFSRLRFTY